MTAMVMPSYFIGLNREKTYALVEIGWSIAFAALIACSAAADWASPDLVIWSYIGLSAGKCASYILAAPEIVITAVKAPLRKPSVPLILRFGSKSWGISVITAVAYRGVIFSILNAHTSTDKGQIHLLWAIGDRMQMLIGVANTLIYRALASGSTSVRGMFVGINYVYPLTATVTFGGAAGASALWFHFLRQPLDAAAFALLPLFALWGGRALFQNLLLAQRRFTLVMANALGLLLLVATATVSLNSVGADFLTLAVVTGVLLSLSMAHLTWSINRE
ncbi:MAG: hypothetical protein MH112_00035 [Phenylobacterium sp.]|uniref:hypothetical protein n=1 Tax=Phenylobacterium sp. TaxID=1871053 RepID=UPI0025DA325D|nr:hypothetical protein [Phenylobacterium sp.]MCG9914733.1 hypothetical protein [Phenylobacterium sp.]